ncbi:MAG: dihydrofolate reductase [Bifidobacteriaceae bacterium]|jgi:dihydrofolate reductase|nr:dihydrofolate reductase [Bifidobacteriaceae bacterium]MCI1914600.1 dihydrofolate reductase [Bifidobacteriaceae bacterium]
MEHDSSRSGYHEPGPVEDGHEGKLWGEPAQELNEPSYSINLIWAEARSTDGLVGAIGNAGGMPWHLSEDLRRFADLTVSHPVIMGRKTWESLGENYRPLPNRDNIVISHDAQYKASGATVVESLGEALGFAKEEAIPDDGIDRSEIWIIGGGTLFKECIAEASAAYVTELDTVVSADVYAPDVRKLAEQGDWKRVEVGEWLTPQKVKDSAVIPRYRFVRYVHVADPWKARRAKEVAEHFERREHRERDLNR